MAYFRKLWRTHRDEAVLLAVTFLITALSGMVLGIASGVALSLILTLYRTSRPHAVELGWIGGVYRNLNRFPQAVKAPGQLLIRYDGPLNYASQSHFKDYILSRIEIREAKGDPIHRVVLSAKSIPTSMPRPQPCWRTCSTDSKPRHSPALGGGHRPGARQKVRPDGAHGEDHFHTELAHAMGEATRTPGASIATQSFRGEAE